MSQVLQQPLGYLEEDEEEIYISESLQEITDGISCLKNYNTASVITTNPLTDLMLRSAPPSIQVPPEDLCVEPGQPVTFTAIITGRPAPKIQWYKVGLLQINEVWL